MVHSFKDTYAFSNGYKIPCLGYGTYQTEDGEVAAEAVKAAINIGYRHIDAAFIYENEAGVGRGIQESGVAREDLFITGKVWNDDRGYDNTMREFEKSLSDLRVDYLDLYLIHWPAAPHQFENWEELNLDTWRALCDLYKEGRVKAIGVSNFKPKHLEALMKTEIKPMVNQIEFHPGQMQEDVVKYCREHGILIEAYSPLGTGEMLKNETLTKIAQKYQRSVAQLCLRWCVQHEIIPLAKSVTPSRMEENTKIFDFEISAEDMEVIDSMPYCGGSGLDPDTVDF